MKHLKTYESIEDDPQVGDYVIFNMEDESPWAKEFFSKNPSKIVHIRPKDFYPKELIYEIESYKQTIPRHIQTTYIVRNDILYWAKSYEQLKLKQSMSKYNI